MESAAPAFFLTVNFPIVCKAVAIAWALACTYMQISTLGDYCSASEAVGVLCLHNQHMLRLHPSILAYLLCCFDFILLLLQNVSAWNEHSHKMRAEWWVLGMYKSVQ